MPVKNYKGINGENVPLDLDDPEDRAIYEEAVKKGTIEKEKDKKPEFLSREDLLRRAVSGGAGYLVGNIPGAIAGAAFPPEDLTDFGLMLGGGAAAGKVSQLIKGLTKNAPNIVKAGSQVLGGMGYGTAENALAKKLKGTEGSLLPTSGSELAGIAMGGIPGLFTNTASSPAARTANLMERIHPTGKPNPSQNERMVEKGRGLLQTVEDAQKEEIKFSTNLADAIKEYRGEARTIKKTEIKAKAQIAKNQQKAKEGRQETKLNEVVQKTEFRQNKERIQSEVKDFERQVGEMDEMLKKNPANQELFQRRQALMDEALVRKMDLDQMQKQRDLQEIQNLEAMKVDPKKAAANKTLRENIVRIQGRKEELKQAIEDTQSAIEKGSFGNLEISNLFKMNKPPNGNTETLLDTLLGQNPSVIQNFMEHYKNKGKGDLMRGAILQHIVEKSYDPQTNSLGGGFRYLTSENKGNVVERLEQVLGNRDEAERVVKSFKEVSEAAQRITKNKISSSLAGTVGTGMVFSMAELASGGSGLKKALHISMGEGGVLAYLKWGTLLNKMASSEKFNKQFTEWMRNGAPAEMLKQNEYLLSQIRELGYTMPRPED